MICDRCNTRETSNVHCDTCIAAESKDCFPGYPGTFDPETGEYTPVCNTCWDEGWYRRPISGSIIPCYCNPEHLRPNNE